MGGRLVRPRRESSSPIEAVSDELLVEIITRLDDDIKCTFRCKSVCKRWLRLINPNPLSPKSDSYLIRRYLSRRPDPAPIHCLLHSFDDYPFQITNIHTSINGLTFPCPDPYILSSCANGLILCCPGPYDHSAYFICNPVTKQWLSLPPPPRARSETGRVLAGLAIDDDRFRVVCLPSRNESSDLAVEVFSSETGQWATRAVERVSAALPRPSCFQRMVVCSNGIAYWLECSVFTAFSVWDGSFRFIPAPCTSKDRYIRFAGQCQGFLRAVTCSHLYVKDDGPTYEVYVLRDGAQWFLEHVIRLRRLTSTSNWLLRYPWRTSQHILFIAFHPRNGHIVYMRCKYYIVECDMQSGEWRTIGKVEGGSISDHRTEPLMLPWWPTPLPRMNMTK